MSGFRRVSALGPLALVLREDPDLRSALELLIRYEHIYIGTLDGRLAESDGLVTVHMWLEAGKPVPLHQSLDLVAANLMGIIRALVRPDWDRWQRASPIPRRPISALFAGSSDPASGSTRSSPASCSTCGNSTLPR